MSKKKVFKLKLTKSTEISITAKTNIVLPRGLTALCNKSLLRKILKTPEKIIFAFFNLLALGFELEQASRRYPGLLITEGLEGVHRHEIEKEAAIQRRILMELKRRRFTAERYLANKIIYSLTTKGEVEHLKRKIRNINHQEVGSNEERCVIVFDIPEEQRNAREVFRRFLKECRFKKLQKSVWCAHADCVPHLQRLITDLGIRRWVRIIHAKKII